MVSAAELRTLVALATIGSAQGVFGSTATNWSAISADFESLWAHYLPPVPAWPLNATYNYIDSERGPFQTLSLSVGDLGDDSAMASVFCPTNDNATSWPRDAIRAGPEVTCGEDISCSGLSGSQCRATQNSESIQLGVKLGTHWARVSAHPSYAMYRFPAVPNAASAALRYELDGRYGSELYGGHPCANATAANPKFAGYACTLCVDEDYGAWGATVGAGFFVLWSAAGRSAWEVTGPVVPYDMEDSSATYGLLESPDRLDLQEGEELVVVFVVTSQYPGRVEAPAHVGTSASATPWGTYKCTANGASTNVRDKPLMLKTVTVFTRGSFSPPRAPDAPPDGGAANASVPRLGGANAAWFNATVVPWLELPCDPDASAWVHGGWPSGGSGVVDFKSVFEDQALGFRACDMESQLDFNDIGEHWAATLYLTGESLSSYKRESALHLLRRLDACHRGHISHSGGGDTTVGSQRCQFNESETARLRVAVLQRELVQDWGDLSVGENGVWYWEYTWLSSGGYDLITSETVGYWAEFVDVLRPYMTAANLTNVAAKMEERIDLFLDIFYGGSWALWNGNNWTPYLCIGAVKWAIVFWHEEPDKAKEVLRVVYDVLWLHRSQYLEEPTIFASSSSASLIEASVYSEGVAVYSLMSTQSLLEIAYLVRASFGEAPPAIEALAERIEKLPEWQIRTLGSDAMLVPFGDSHRKRGFDSPAVLHALLAREVLFNDTATDAVTAVGGSTSSGFIRETNEPRARGKAMTARLIKESSCLVRRWMSGAYYQSYKSPYDFPVELAKNWTAIVAACGSSALNESAGWVLAQPLGGVEDIVLETGGFAALRTPLLPRNASAYMTSTTTTIGGEICLQSKADASGDGEGCLSGDSAAVVLSANNPYSVLALEAKSSSSPHAEVDFGTLVWTAWGTRLLSEHGYGTIGTSVASTDTRRFDDVDNNPSGHNTLVIRQAVSSGEVGSAAEGTFSQFNNIPGTVSFVARNAEGWDGKVLGRPCVDLDGSAPYGSERIDGWLDVFHRFACPLPGGHFLLLDAMAIKANRSALSLSGGYGGPAFEEGGAAHAALDLATYFHADVETELSDSGAETAFAFPSSGWCAHVDVNVTTSAERRVIREPAADEGSSISSSRFGDLALLIPRCGLGRSRASDGIAAIAGWSSSGGNWTGGALVQGADTSGNPTYLRRVVWEGGPPLTAASSQVRAFVLAAAAAPGTSVADVRAARASAAASAVGASWGRWDLAASGEESETDNVGGGDGGSDGFRPDYSSAAGADALLEASSATDEQSGAPLAWARACPPPADAATLRRFGGCCSGLAGSFAPLAAPASARASQPVSPECACVEACAGGRLFWATLNGSFPHPQRLGLAHVSWAGGCNATHATRRPSLRVAGSTSGSGGAACGPTPRPTEAPTLQPSAPTPRPSAAPAPEPSAPPSQAVGAWAAVSSALVLSGVSNRSAFASAGGAVVVAGALGRVLGSALGLPATEAQAAVTNVAAAATNRRRHLLGSSTMASFVFTLEFTSLGLVDASAFLTVVTTALTEGAADGTLAAAVAAEANGTALAAVTLDAVSTAAAVASESSVAVLSVVTRRPSRQPSAVPAVAVTPVTLRPTDEPTVSTAAVAAVRNSTAALPPALLWAAVCAGAMVLAVAFWMLRRRSRTEDAQTSSCMDSDPTGSNDEANKEGAVASTATKTSAEVHTSKPPKHLPPLLARIPATGLMKKATSGTKM